MNLHRALNHLFGGVQSVSRTSFLAAAASLALSGAASAQSVPQIGIKFGINSSNDVQNLDPGALLPTDMAGAPAYAQTNWNNFGRYGADDPVMDSSGATNGVTVSWDCNNLWSQNGGGTPSVQTVPDFKLMNGYLDSNGNQTNFLDLSSPVDGYASTNANCKPWIYFQGLNAWMTANHVSQYDVVVYTDGDNNGGRGGAFWLQNATGPWTGPGMTLGSDITTHSFITVRSVYLNDSIYKVVPPTLQSGRESQGGNFDGNIVVFNSVTNDSFLLRKNTYNFRCPINAVQIIPRATPLAATIDPLLPATVYSGGTASFQAKVAGIVPMSFQWMKDGSPVSDGGNISGSQTSTLTITGVGAGNVGNYSLVVSNAMGQVTSSTAALAVTSPTVGSYAEKIFTNGPVAYWQLADTGDPSTNYSVAMDSAGGFSGTYESAALNGYYGVLGPQPPAFPNFATGSGALQSSSSTRHSWVIAPPLNLNTNTVTITAWVYPTTSEPNNCGIVFSRGDSGDVDGLGYHNNNNLGYTWLNQSATYNFVSGLVVPSNMWSFVALTITPTNATIYLFNSQGIATAVNNYTNAPAAFSGATTIGVDPSSAGAPEGRAFIGSIAQAAVFNYDVPALEVYNMYKKGVGLSIIPAAISTQPQSLVLSAGRPAVFHVGASGDTPLTYQWRSNSVDLVNGGRISGANSATLTVADVSSADATTYDVVVDNVAHQPVTSAPATLTVVASNSAPVAYEAAVEAANPVGYWRFNEQPGGGPYAYDYWGGDIATNVGVSAGDSAPQPPTFPGFETTNSANLYINLPSFTDTREEILNNLSQFTIIGWFYSEQVQLSGANLFGQSGGVAVGFSPDLGVSTPGGGSVTIPNSSSNIVQSQWYMVAAVGDGHKLSIYLASPSGLGYASTQVTTTNYGSSQTSFTIGNGFGGDIDEVAVFNHALTADQISTIFASATSASGTMAPIFASQPRSLSLYEGRTAQFSAGALATAPVTYQWQKDGADITDGGNVSGSTTENLTIANITQTNAGVYNLVVSNSVAVATSSNATLVVVAPPTGGYGAAVLSMNPLAYYPLNETNDPSTGTAVDNDYWGGNSGLYGTAEMNGFNGIAGPRPPAFSTFASDNYAVQFVTNNAGSYATAPFGSLSTNTVTMCMWIMPTGPRPDWAGLLMNRSVGVEGGFGFAGDGQHLGYTWNNNSTWGFNSGILPPLNIWSFVAMAVSPTNAIMYMFNANGEVSATNTIAHTSDVFGNNWRIGMDFNDGSRNFNGLIDEVAVFTHTLSGDQLLQLYQAGTTGIIKQGPTLTVTRSGNTLNVSWSPTGGTLQSTTDLTNPNSWTDVGTANPASVTIGSGNLYLRVVQ